MPPVDPECALRRDAPPHHAVSESDRLLARPQDRSLDPLVSSALTAWRNWAVPDLTLHDGLVGTRHPLLATLFLRPQSPTSLSRLLRDPLAYVWYYALGWRDLVHKERGLVLPPDDMGRLVHELLRRTVDHLELRSGFTAAARHEIEDALGLASDHVIETWPLVVNVPPPVLWTNTVRRAAEMSLEGLTFESFTEAGTRSWTEVAFGGEKGASARPRRPPPWDPAQPVLLPGTDIKIQGTIDRLDLRASAVAVRVTDYKTGERPKSPEVIVAGGRELQRVLYSLACRVLLPDTKPLRARLIYLRPPVQVYPLNNPDNSIDLVASWVKIARSVLEAGTVYPGIATMLDRFGQLALPAAARYVERRDNATARYVERKSNAIRQAAGKDLIAYWRAK
nr:PD-(D/E)XK nuclease family protein [Reyranella sp.]